MTTANEATPPEWWDRQHDSAWDRVKAAFRRDWEQTKHDFGADEPDLNQNFDDTVAQAAGSRSIPASKEPNYEAQEPALRFGHGARMYYGEKYPDWNEELDSQLQEDWPDDWPASREAVRRGWEYSRINKQKQTPK